MRPAVLPRFQLAVVIHVELLRTAGSGRGDFVGADFAVMVGVDRVHQRRALFVLPRRRRRIARVIVPIAFGAAFPATFIILWRLRIALLAVGLGVKPSLSTPGIRLVGFIRLIAFVAFRLPCRVADRLSGP